MSLMEKEVIEMAEDARRKYNREYQRKWRRRNPDRVREIQLRYWAHYGLRLKKQTGGTLDGSEQEE